MQDRRLSSTLHALLHLADHGEAMTSDEMADCIRTNAVVVRRLLGKLRDARLVVANKGRGGGWSLARPLDKISLADVYTALGIRPGARRDTPLPTCVIERAAVERVAIAQAAADAVFTEQLAAISLRHLADDTKRRAHRARRHS